jgi:L-threonylcarbamoyladenylate synthase
MLKTKTSRVHAEKPASSVIEDAAELIRQGGLVVYPTESAYALGCNALDEDAVKRVFEAKRRRPGAPLPIIVSDVEMWEKCAFLDDRVKKLIKEFLPGPLTIALRKKPIVPNVLNPKAIAARISSHPVACALVGRAGVPITATSANVSGKPHHYTARQVMKDLAGRVDLVLDAGRLPRRRLSTIVDFTLGRIPRITRAGAIPEKAILRVLSAEVVAD